MSPQTTSSGRAPTQQAAHSGTTRPDWSRFSRVVMTLGAISLTFTLFKNVSSIVAPVFLALNLVIVVYPVFGWLVKRKVPRLLAATAMLLLVLGILGLFLWGIGYSVAAVVSQVSGYGPQIQNLYQNLLHWLSGFGISQDMLAQRLKSLDPSSITGAASSLVSSAQGGLALLSTLVLLLFFMCMDSTSMHERLKFIERDHAAVADGLHRFAEGVRRYWVVSTVFGLIVAALNWGSLVVLGVPLALVWALLSFLTNYIPNIGFVIGLVPPTLLALFQKGWKPALLVVASYCVFNFIIQSLIQPRYLGNAVGITTTLSFVSLLVWGVAFGALGALIAVPSTLFVKTMLIDTDPDARWVNALISSKGADDATLVHDQPGSYSADLNVPD